MTTENIIAKQRAQYQPNYLKHRNTPKGTFQNNTETQFLRFEKLLKNLPIHDNSVHDIGCGIADLHHYMIKKDIKHTYFGTDIVPEMIDYAKLTYPESVFYIRDLLSIVDAEKYDFSVLSGTLNLLGEIEQNKWKTFCFNLIKKMFDMSHYAISFNCLTSYSTFSDPTLAYFSPEEVSKFCLSNLSRFIDIQHNYALYEFTVTVYTTDFIKKQYTDEAFHKYF